MDLVGFRTGSIIHCHRFDGALGSIPSSYHRVLRKELRDIKPELLSRMLKELGQVDLHRLQSVQGLWPSVSERTWHNDGGTLAQELGTPEAWLVVTFTSECINKELLVGVGFGKFASGDTIIHLLGHQNAIAMHRRGNGLHSHRFIGQLVCAKRNLEEATQDIITQQASPFYTIQNETDCVASVERIPLQVTPSELLFIAQ